MNNFAFLEELVIIGIETIYKKYLFYLQYVIQKCKIK